MRRGDDSRGGFAIEPNGFEGSDEKEEALTRSWLLRERT
jgi:hypothetical protein